MRLAFILLPLLLLSSLCSAQSVRIVDKDRHDFGVEAKITDRVSMALVTSSDQKGQVVDASIFKTRRLVQIAAVEPSSYYVLKLDCPFSGTIIEMQSVDRLRTLAVNSFALAAKNDPAAALAFSELAARTSSIDSDYSQMARKRSLEISVAPIVDSFTLDELNNVLLYNRIVTKPFLTKGQVTPAFFLSDDKMQGKFVINKAYSQLIQEYQGKQFWNFEYQKGQLDYPTLKSFSDFKTNDFLFKTLVEAGYADVPLPKELTR